MSDPHGHVTGWNGVSSRDDRPQIVSGVGPEFAFGSMFVLQLLAANSANVPGLSMTNALRMTVDC